MSGSGRLQDELDSKVDRNPFEGLTGLATKFAVKQHEQGGVTGADDRYMQMLRTVIAQSRTVQMTPAESMMLKIISLSATGVIQDPQKRMNMLMYINSSVQVRMG